MILLGPESFHEWAEKNPAPTPEMLEDPLFCAIWEAIKGWDIGCKEYEGHAGAMGNHARAVYEAIRGAELARAERQVRMLRELCVLMRQQAELDQAGPNEAVAGVDRAKHTVAGLKLVMVECIETNLDQTL